MSDNNIVRKYRFSDAELKQAATAQLSLIQRDITEFSRYGFNASKQVQYQTVLDAFYNFPSDDILESQQMICTATKNDARTLLEQDIRIIQQLATLAFPNSPAYHRAFGDTAISRMTDVELLETALTIQQAFIKYSSHLAPFGVDSNRMNEFQNILIGFTTAYHKQKEAINERDIQVSQRIEAGNAVYDLLAQYAGLAQVLFHSKSDPRRNEYVIYDKTNTNSNNNMPPVDDNNTNSNDNNNNSIPPSNRTPN